jgi:hypothetical protein
LTQIERYVVTDRQLLQNPTFASGLSWWDLYGNGEVQAAAGEVSIINRQVANQSVSQRLNVAGPGFVRLSLRAEVDALVTGGVRWAGASATVSMLDKAGALIHRQVIFSLKADAQPRQFELVQHHDSSVAELVVTLRLLQSTGTFKANQIVVSSLDETSVYKRARWLIIMSWVLSGLVLASFFSSQLSAREFAFLGGVSVVGLIGITLPGLLFGRIRHLIAEAFPDAIVGFWQLIPNTGFELGDLLHFLLFFVVGTMLGAKVQMLGFYYSLAAMAVIAVFTESLQLFVNDRSTSLSDFVFDLIGGALGFGLLLTVRYLYTQRKNA